MTRRLNDAEFLDALDDLIIEDILAMSPEELRAEIVAEGEDPDAVAADARASLDRAIRETKAAREAETKPAGSDLPACASFYS